MALNDKFDPELPSTPPLPNTSKSTRSVSAPPPSNGQYRSASEELDALRIEHAFLKEEYSSLLEKSASNESLCSFFQNQFNKISAVLDSHSFFDSATMEVLEGVNTLSARYKAQQQGDGGGAQSLRQQLSEMTAARNRHIREWEAMASQLQDLEKELAAERKVSKKRLADIKRVETECSAQLKRQEIKMEQFVLTNGAVNQRNEALQFKLTDAVEEKVELQSQISSISQTLRSLALGKDGDLGIADSVQLLATKYQALFRRQKEGKTTLRALDRAHHRYESPFRGLSPTKKSPHRVGIPLVVRTRIDRTFKLNKVMKCLDDRSWTQVCGEGTVRVYCCSTNDVLTIAIQQRAKPGTVHFKHPLPSRHDADFKADPRHNWARWRIEEDLVDINMEIWVCLYLADKHQFDAFCPLFRECAC